MLLMAMLKYNLWGNVLSNLKKFELIVSIPHIVFQWIVKIHLLVYKILFLHGNICYVSLENILKGVDGNKTLYVLLHGPNKELHDLKLDQLCSLHSISYNVILSYASMIITQPASEIWESNPLLQHILVQQVGECCDLSHKFLGIPCILQLIVVNLLSSDIKKTKEGEIRNFLLQ